ncbi:heme-degrading domain-containing protein [Luteimicrobium subarcticum]|uniref:UPF0303 protein CLV34_2442 n=1 Tax=Luteimicrobium subarcticum TaxID=620910 RepID=A0A2M8WJR2_9MICO|nr:heme-degrading domain-containing protein [Luteimicrobium subarcticum]PJI91174.1 uncharacterized protein (UPF0303 family) [Luteimicrobium subarcticum]
MADDTALLRTRLAELHEEDRRLVLPRFTLDDAWEVGSRLRALAVERSLPVVVDVRRGAQQVFRTALDGTSADNDSWVERKVAVVRRFDAASLLVGLRHRAKGRDFTTATGLPFQEYAAHGGSVPVRVEGVGQVGVVTVSGLAQEDDHALVVEVLEQLVAGGAR